MSLDLPEIPSRYPAQYPTYDISQYLISGCTPFSEGSVMVTVQPNHVLWDCRISTGSAVDDPNRRFLQGLPEELRPPVGVSRIGTLGEQLTRMQWHTGGWIFLGDPTKRLIDGSIAFEARTLRRAT